MFSNWRSLLGINQELLGQLEDLTHVEEINESTPSDVPKSTSSRREPNILVRVTFQKERASKTLLINTSHTGQDLVEMAIKKVIPSLPTSEQSLFRSHYENCELFDNLRSFKLGKSFLDQLPRIEEQPHVTIRKAHKKATDIGECFLQMVNAFSFIVNLLRKIQIISLRGKYFKDI